MWCEAPRPAARGCDANPLVDRQDTSSRRGGGRRAKRAGWRGRAVGQEGCVYCSDPSAAAMISTTASV